MNKKQIEFMHNSTVAQQFTHKIEVESRRDKLRLYAPLVLLIVLTLTAGIFIDNFFSPKNIINLLYQMSIPLVLATGVTFVLLIGSIDLSVEGVMGFSGAVVSLLVTNSMNDINIGFFGILLTLVMATLFGVITGFLHVKLRIASFIITYAMGSIITGFGILSYGGTPSRVLWPVYDIIAQETFLNIPVLTWICLGIFALVGIILNYTAFGKA
ncbi:MAG: ABC transporter permease, partial [Spirochaetales bacterium]